MTRNIFKIILLFIVATVYGFAAITGTAFRDFNANGIREAAEPLAPGIKVRAYSNDATNKDSLVAEAVTDQNGQYSLSVPADKLPVRIEFGLDANNCLAKRGEDFSSGSGLTYGTSIQFAKSDGESHNFALSYPSDYSTVSNPYTFVPVWISGNGLAADGDTDWRVTGNRPAIGKIRLKDSGQGYSSGGNVNYDVTVTQSQVGTINGLAYSKEANKLFAAAYLHRRTGMGPLGSGGIYLLDPDK